MGIAYRWTAPRGNRESATRVTSSEKGARRGTRIASHLADDDDPQASSERQAHDSADLPGFAGPVDEPSGTLDEDESRRVERLPPSPDAGTDHHGVRGALAQALADWDERQDAVGLRRSLLALLTRLG